MNKNLKKQLKSAFQAPPPTGKELFLKQLRYPKTTYMEFLVNQITYIRKRIWIASILVLVLGWVTVFQQPLFHYIASDRSIVRSISAILPFLSMMTITEVYRSSSYHMVELEESCRFHSLQIVMARVLILGITNFVILLLLLIFLNQASAYSLLQTILYVMMPYLFVSVACLWILNKTRGSDGLYACAVATVLFSISSLLCENLLPFLYTNRYLIIWLVLFVGSLTLIGFQMHKLIKQLEEKQWNLYLTE